MLSPSFRELVKCRTREFMREPSAMYWVIFMPIVWMVVLGFAFSNPRPEVYGVGWLTSPSTNAAPKDESSREALAKDGQVKLREGTADELDILFRRGEVSMLVDANHDGARYEFDSHNPEAVRAKNHVDQVIQIAHGRTNPVMTQDQERSGQGRRYVDFLIPGLLGMSIMSTSLFGVGMTLVANRRENLLKRYLATPMKTSEFILSHIIGRYLALAAEFSAIMLSGWLIFQFKVFGNIAAYVVLCLLGTAAFTALAMLLASRTRSIPVISGINNLLMIPMLMLSGVFFSKNNFPDWLREASRFLPLTAINDGLRKIALEGQSFGAVGFEMAVLLAYFVICAGLARRLFKWY